MRFNPYEADSTAYGHLFELARHLAKGALDPEVRALVEIRASQINGCAFCLAMHADGARKHGVEQTKLDLLAGWRESDDFTIEERAALALVEEMVRIGDGGRVEAATWDAARSAFSDEELSALMFSVTLIQSWNMLNVTVEMPPGIELPRPR